MTSLRAKVAGALFLCAALAGNAGARWGGFAGNASVTSLSNSGDSALNGDVTVGGDMTVRGTVDAATGTFANLSAPGLWILVASATVTDVTNYTFTGLASTQAYRLDVNVRTGINSAQDFQTKFMTSSGGFGVTYQTQWVSNFDGTTEDVQLGSGGLDTGSGVGGVQWNCAAHTIAVNSYMTGSLYFETRQTSSSVVQFHVVSQSSDTLAGSRLAMVQGMGYTTLGGDLGRVRFGMFAGTMTGTGFLYKRVPPDQYLNALNIGVSSVPAHSHSALSGDGGSTLSPATLTAASATVTGGYFAVASTLVVNGGIVTVSSMAIAAGGPLAIYGDGNDEFRAKFYGSNDFRLGTIDGGTLSLMVSAGRALTIPGTGANAGYVGIGTAYTPQTPLDVNGGATLRGQLTTTSSVTIHGTGNVLSIGSSGDAGFVFRNTAGAGMTRIAATGNINWTTNAGSAIILPNSQKVGVNTSTPATNLDVEGSAQFGSGANKATATASGFFVPACYTKAAANALTPVVGGALCCSDCANPYTHCVGTGTVAGQLREQGTTTGCY